MSELIQMRQRIKAIQTIKKITHAMRLIAMSTHSQLKHQQGAVTSYIAELKRVYAVAKGAAPDWNSPIMSPGKESNTHLIVLVGSQKGLCGSFNSLLFGKFKRHIKTLSEPYHLIVIGQKAVDYIRQAHLSVPVTNLPTFSTKNLKQLSFTLFDTITGTQPPYKSVEIFSNQFVSFFTQKPQKTTLTPITKLEESDAQEPDLLWPEPAPEILNQLVQRYLQASLYALLYDSLIAEQAARFISMDSATRNADGLLENTKLAYNKLRQAKITKELIELTGSL